MGEGLKTKNNNRKKVIGTVILLLSMGAVIMLYWRWFLPGGITYGDWYYYAKGSLSDLTASIWGAGLGGYRILSLSSAPLVMFIGFLFRTFGWSYSVIERITCFFPLIFLLIFSPWYLARTLGYRRVGIAAVIIVFNLNTYIFFISAVTNMALAIALVPLIIALFIQAIQSVQRRYEVLFALVFALEMVYDMRIAYIAAALCFLYFIYHLITNPPRRPYNYRREASRLFLMALVVVLLHSYMLIPFLFGRASGTTFIALPEGYNNAGWVRTLSYWNLLHVLGLQVPWWGKPGILNPPNPHFLLIPILAFSVFLFSIKQKRTVLFFGIVALIFSFLAKGSKPPFGQVYIWLFLHFPGFIMFREPGKWWSPVILSYAVLIGGLVNYLINGENINRLLKWFKKRFNLSASLAKVSLTAIALGIFLIIFPVNPMSTVRYSANFVSRPLPKEAGHIENFLHSQPKFFRVLWLPVFYRFGYSSGQHPAVSGIDLPESLLLPLRFINPPEYPYVSPYFGQPFGTFFLRLLSVKYVLVPFELYYDPSIYYWYGHLPEYYNRLAEKTPGFKPVSFNGKSQVYEVPDPFPHFYAASDSIVITEADIGIFPEIAEAKMAENTSLFFLANRLPEELLKKMNNFIFQNSTWEDLTVDLCKKTKLGSFREVSLGQRDRQKANFKIEEAGDYEIYLDTDDLPEDEVPILIAEIDGKEISPAAGYYQQILKRKYIKFGEMKFERGKHAITYKIKNRMFNINEKDLKIILVPKEEREKEGKIIWEITNRPGIKVSRILRKNRKFYLSQESDLKVKVKVTPYLFRKKGKVGIAIRFDDAEKLKDWFISPSKVPCEYSIYKNKVLFLSSHFKGDAKADEFVQMKNESIRVNLEKYPYFNLTYRIEDPEVQTIEVVAGIDFDKDGKVNEYIRGIYPRPASVFWDNFRYNFYSKVKAKFPDKKYYELVKLELYPHKLWKVDCSTPKRKGKYRFWIKGLKFSNYSPREFFESFKDALDVDLNSEEEIKNWSVERKGKIRLELSRKVNKINLRQFPMIELDCKIKDPELQKIDFILGLDFDGDAIADKDIFLDYLVTSKEWGKFQFDAYGLVKEVYPAEKEYNLIKIALGLSEQKIKRPKEGYPSYFKRLRVFSSSLVSTEEAIFDRPVFAIDKERFRLKAKFKGKANIEDLRFERTLFLERGEHYLNKLEDGSFKVDWVIVEPRDGKDKKENRNEPKITFRRVNLTKYQVKVKGAKKPFWLVFSESFHDDWKLYSKQKTENRKQQAEEIAAEYPNWGVKEAKYKWGFSPGDIKYLFGEPLDTEHQLVNFYANAWWIDPEALNLPEDFNLVVFFRPQSLFCLGLLTSGLTLGVCLLYLLWGWRKKKNNESLV